MRTFPLIISALILCGCAARVIPVTVPFTDDEYARYSGAGPCSVQGQAFLKTRGGSVKYAAGEDVKLLPYTPYLAEILNINAVYGQQALATDQRYWSTKRNTVADAEGHFEFSKLPCGDYYIETRVTWEIPISAYTSETEGGVVSSPVTLREEESPKKIVMTW